MKKKIPLRVKFAIWILAKYCEKFYWCEHCPLYSVNRGRKSCIFNFKNPYAVNYELKRKE